MTILQSGKPQQQLRCLQRYDVIDECCRLLGIFDSRKSAEAYITWRPAKPNSYENEVHRKHEAWKARRTWS